MPLTTLGQASLAPDRPGAFPSTGGDGEQVEILKGGGRREACTTYCPESFAMQHTAPTESARLVIALKALSFRTLKICPLSHCCRCSRHRSALTTPVREKAAAAESAAP